MNRYHKNWHKKQPGSQDRFIIHYLFIFNKSGLQQQNLNGTAGSEVISSFHQCTIQANHRNLTVEFSGPCQDPACLANPHKEETQ